jgi:hypothetical protein
MFQPGKPLFRRLSRVRPEHAFGIRHQHLRQTSGSVETTSARAPSVAEVASSTPALTSVRGRQGGVAEAVRSAVRVGKSDSERLARGRRTAQATAPLPHRRFEHVSESWLGLEIARLKPRFQQQPSPLSLEHCFRSSSDPGRQDQISGTCPSARWPPHARSGIEAIVEHEVHARTTELVCNTMPPGSAFID